MKKGKPKPELGPLALSYDPTASWVVEKFGLSSKHWKRLARDGKPNEASIAVSPIKQKKEGPTPLSKLDPNALELKRRRGKRKAREETENDQMVGGVAVVVGQHCRAQ